MMELQGKLESILERHKYDKNSALYTELKDLLEEKTSAAGVNTFHAEIGSSELNEFLTTIMTFEKSEAIYKYTGEYLSSIYPDTIIFINLNNPEEDTMMPLEIFFPDKSFINKVTNLLGVKLQGKVFPKNPEIESIFQTGKLTRLKGGLLEISNGYFSPVLMNSVSKVLKIRDVYIIGLNRANRLFACIQFYSFKNSRKLDLKFIETISNQVSIAVQKLYYQEQLRQSEYLYRNLFEGALNPIAIYNLEGKLLMINNPSIKNDRQNYQQLIGLKVKDFLPEKSEQFMNKISIVAKTREPLQYEDELGEGENKLFLFSVMHPIMDQKNEIIGVQVVSYDITDRKLAEIAIKDNEEKFSSIFHSVFSGVIIFDAKGNIIDANKRACVLYGYEYEEMIQLSIQHITTALTLKENFWRVNETLKTDSPQQFESQDKRKNGELFYSLISISPLKLSRGIFLVAVIKDITEMKKFEKLIVSTNNELKKAIATKDKFFSIISHDLRSPFSGILGLANLLKEESEIDDFTNVNKYAQSLLTVSQNTYELLNNLLTWSRLQLGLVKCEPEFFQVHELINYNIQLLKPSADLKGIIIQSNIKGVETIFACKNNLQIVLFNLISNAIKYTNSGDVVSIEADKKDSDILFSVSDTGVGIQPERIPFLFTVEGNESTPGTKNEKGSGLGLVLCKEFIEKEGGAIWLESKVGIGTTFYFSIPNQNN